MAERTRVRVPPQSEPHAAGSVMDSKQARAGLEEPTMARIVVQCQYTRHYILTNVETRSAAIVAGGPIRCPYCDADHVWTCDSRRDEAAANRPMPRALIRQAS